MEDSMIRIMLKDEYDRTLRMIEAYKDELKKYPVGSPVIIHICILRIGITEKLLINILVILIQSM